MSSLRIFIADRQEMVRRVLITLLAFRPEWEICGETGDGIEAVKKISKLKPDIVLLDIDVAGINGLEATRQILQNNSSQKVIILTMSDGEQFASDIFHAGALGFVLKARATHDLVAAIEAVQSGQTFFTPRFAESILKGYLSSSPLKETAEQKLTARERATVQLLSNELAITLSRRLSKPGIFRRNAKYLTVGVAVAVTVVAGWFTFNGVPDQVLSATDRLFVILRLRTAQAPISNGNPNAKVWVDLHTALYYCPGEKSYGRTSGGRFTRQRDALQDHLDPASHVCN
ncbi:MAG TPA: response regulator transcription factor [Terriglobales bacterium]|nr:response regulator transcription factor [Terriglobales bacterium]